MTVTVGAPTPLRLTDTAHATYSVEGTRSPRQGRAQILHDSDLNAFNGFDNPNRLVVKQHEVGGEGQKVKITLPAMSVATITLQTA